MLDGKERQLEELVNDDAGRLCRPVGTLMSEKAIGPPRCLFFPLHYQWTGVGLAHVGLYTSILENAPASANAFTRGEPFSYGTGIPYPKCVLVVPVQYFKVGY